MTALAILAVSSPGLAAWVWGGGCLAIVVALPLLLSRRAIAQRTARREFGRLAAANDLTRAEARVLWRFGCAADPSQPQLAFVRPTLLDSPDRRAAPEIVQSLREKLFSP